MKGIAEGTYGTMWRKKSPALAKVPFLVIEYTRTWSKVIIRKVNGCSVPRIQTDVVRLERGSQNKATVLVQYILNTEIQAEAAERRQGQGICSGLLVSPQLYPSVVAKTRYNA